MAIRTGEDAILGHVGEHSSNVTIGKDIQIHMPNGEPLEARLARMDVRLMTVERAQSTSVAALMLVALALVAQTIWLIQSQNTALREISSEISEARRHIVRLDALLSTNGRSYFDDTPPTPWGR